ncbi:MAG: SDR family oxidoreductase [Gammaproteobacteria bacterium]
MQIKDKIAVVTGAAGGIGFAVAARLAQSGARAIAMVDRAEECADAAGKINRDFGGRAIARGFCGDVCDAAFRAEVFSQMENADDCARICVPAAGILRDAMAVKIDRDSGAAQLYDEGVFRRVLEVNLLHPVYWAMQMTARIAERRGAAKKWQPREPLQGACVFIGSVSARGNRGQISYASSKSALGAAAKTLNIEGMFHGVQTKILHPGLVATKMAEQLPHGHFERHILPQIPLGRMLTPGEVADAAAMLIESPAISGPVWIDGGMTPMA